MLSSLSSINWNHSLHESRVDLLNVRSIIQLFLKPGISQSLLTLASTLSRSKRFRKPSISELYQMQMSFVVMFVLNASRGLRTSIWFLVFSKSFHPIFWHLIEAYKVQITHALFQNEIIQFTPEHMVLQASHAHIFSFENSQHQLVLPQGSWSHIPEQLFNMETKYQHNIFPVKKTW